MSCAAVRAARNAAATQTRAAAASRDSQAQDSHVVKHSGQLPRAMQSLAALHCLNKRQNSAGGKLCCHAAWGKAPPSQKSGQTDVSIKVVGLGGGGSNAVNRMVASDVQVLALLLLHGLVLLAGCAVVCSAVSLGDSHNPFKVKQLAVFGVSGALHAKLPSLAASGAMPVHT